MRDRSSSHPLKEHVQCLRDCAQHLADLAPQIPEDSETLALTAQNLSVVADTVANLLALHSAEAVAAASATKSATDGRQNLRSQKIREMCGALLDRQTRFPS